MCSLLPHCFFAAPELSGAGAGGHGSIGAPQAPWGALAPAGRGAVEWNEATLTSGEDTEGSGTSAVPSEARVETSSDAAIRCAGMVAALDAAGGWGLDAERLRSYVTAIAPLIPESCPEPVLRSLVTAYHHDHRLVAALRDPADPSHESAWGIWAGQSRRVIGRAVSYHADDPTIALDDLAQVALGAIAESLPSYRFGSRFSTWAYSVIAHSARHHLRDLHAAKRAGRPLSLEQQVGIDAAAPDHSSPEELAAAAALEQLVESLLQKADDQRLAEIFRLWARADMRLIDIGARMQLSASRVSVLLTTARRRLREHPEIQAWLEHEEGVEGR